MKLLYDYINPMTGKKTVLLEGDRMMCVETGIHTHRGWNEKDRGHLPFEKYCSDPTYVSKFVDDLGQVWYKITLFTDSIVLQPTLGDGWEVNSFRDLEEGEIPGDRLQRVQGEKVQILDPQCAKYFSEFDEALDEFDKLRLKENV